jgi:dihydrofolate synthase/folylpolyglutamate synthase
METTPSSPLKADRPGTPQGNNPSAPPPCHNQEALEFWFGRINYEHRSPLPGDLKLERMVRLLDLLGNPHERLRIVHVAGSKGKGSTSAMLASILQQAGYRTGLFTSPHLCRVEERIQVNGHAITPEDLAALVQRLRPAVETLDRTGEPGRARVTFFEVATALGFLYFAQQQVDIAVLEVGLGGRFDSTNVCQPLVALITSISYDHTQQLGNRLGQIAMEKAGIIKPGRPALSGARASEARQVIERICAERGSPLRQLDKEIRFHHVPGQLTDARLQLPRVQILTDRRTWPSMDLGLLGEHQAANAALAVAAVEQLREEGCSVSGQAVSAGLAQVRWPARLEVLAHRPIVLLDCAHNVASAQAVVDTLRESFPRSPAGRRWLIFAGSSDKDLAGMLRVMAPHFTHAYFTRYSHNPRNVSPETLAALWSAVTDSLCTVQGTAPEAWETCRGEAGPEDLICITGSVFLAGELRPLLVDVRLHPCPPA